MTGSSFLPVSAEPGGAQVRSAWLRPLCPPWLRSSPCLSPHSRNDSTITCTMPSVELATAVRVCVQFENKSCASYNITFKYEKNPVISDINPKKSQLR